MKKLQDLYQILQKEFPTQDKTVYGYLENGATLEPGWLLQTPNIWGIDISKIPMQPLRNPGPGIDPDFRLPVCTSPSETCNCKPLLSTVADPKDKPKHLCIGHSNSFADEFYSMIIKAEKTVFISTLGPGPDENFLAALRNAVTRLGHTGNRITFALLIGYPSPATPRREAEYLMHELTRGVRELDKAKVTVKVLVSGTPVVWNHAKIVVVDGKESITGGHNFYQHRYLQEEPVFDLSMKLSGAVSVFAHNYFQEIWKRAQDVIAKWEAVYNPPANNDVPANDEADIMEQPLTVTGTSTAPSANGLSVPALAVGRLPGEWDSEPGERALLYMLEQARESIKISQQNIGYGPAPVTHWPGKFIYAIAKFIVTQKKEVYIVQSDEKASGGYFSGATLKHLEDRLFSAARSVPGAPKEDELKALFRKCLHMGSLRFTNALEWSEKSGFANHTKFIMVDDELLYIGSQNMYVPGPVAGPWRLMEFGYIIGSKEAAKQLLDQYWNKLWKYSAYWVKVYTGRAEYGLDDTVDVFVELNGATQDDTVRFVDESGKEEWWTFTGNIRNGRITYNQYKVPGKYFLKGQTMTIEYIQDGRGERRSMAKSTFRIKPMTVSVTTDKPSYKAGEQVRVSLKVENGIPHNDSVTFHNQTGREDSFMWTHGLTNGTLKETWGAPGHLKGQTVTIWYIHDGGIGGKKWKIASTTFKVE